MIGYERGLLKLRGLIDSKLNSALQIAGFGLLVLIWYVLSMGENPIVRRAILPKPLDSFNAFFQLLRENDLVVHVMHSIGLNLAGYIEAILSALLIGFIVGLYPLFRGLFQRQVDALRFVPLTAVTGIFIVWFGLGVEMKVHFLAFGIFIYLLPVVVQRVDEVADVYLKTAYTLGATNWQIIKTVYIPHVMSKLIDDMRVLTAISWTYIIIAEMLGNEGGVGALIWRTGQRQGRMDKLFALLVIIIIIGAFQDRLFKFLDRHFFPHKYQIKPNYGAEEKVSALQLMLAYLWTTLQWVLLGIYLLLMINEYTGVLTDTKIIEHYFGGTAAIVNLTMLSIMIYQAYTFYKKWKK
jgi:ABC-type nitrate/sulfonate/bicarbonate transport system permease component